MKDNLAAVKKEIKGRATVLVVLFAIVDVMLVIMLAAMWDKPSARIALLVLACLFTALLIVSILAVCNPLKFKWMFRNLKAEQKVQPRAKMAENQLKPMATNAENTTKPGSKNAEKQSKATKAEYKYDKEFGFVSTIFDRPISVSASNYSEDYVKQCIEFFQNMSAEQIDRLAEDAMAYYREIVECTGEAEPNMPETLTGREILDWVYPKVMWIGNDEGREGSIEFIVECDCEWEPEHGMEIVTFDKEIIHVGSYDGDLDYWKEEYLTNAKN